MQSLPAGVREPSRRGEGGWPNGALKTLQRIVYGSPSLVSTIVMAASMPAVNDKPGDQQGWAYHDIRTGTSVPRWAGGADGSDYTSAVHSAYAHRSGNHLELPSVNIDFGPRIHRARSFELRTFG
jgi:hypothetical protein